MNPWGANSGQYFYQFMPKSLCSQQMTHIFCDFHRSMDMGELFDLWVLYIILLGSKWKTVDLTYLNFSMFMGLKKFGKLHPEYEEKARKS